VTWHVAAYDSNGARLTDQQGLAHQPGAAEVVLSLFSLPTESGARPAPVVLVLRRADSAQAAAAFEWRSAPLEAVPQAPR
jgi:hypothetical protein